MKFVLASQNRHKLEEMQSILSAHGVQVALEADLGLQVDVEETGETFAETAHFTSAIACVFPNGDTIEAEGICPGTIAFAPQGTGGFGYDPVFFLPELRKTYAQLTPEEKAAVSHRGKALAVFEGKLKDYLNRG